PAPRQKRGREVCGSLERHESYARVSLRQLGCRGAGACLGEHQRPTACQRSNWRISNAFFGSALAARATDASFDCVRLREHDHKPRRLLASAYASSQLRTLQIKAAQDVPDDLQGFPSGRCISGGGAQSCDEGVLELQASLGLSDLGVV